MLSFVGQGFKGLEKNDLGNKGFGLGNKFCLGPWIGKVQSK